MICTPLQVYLYPHYPDAIALKWSFVDENLPGTFKAWVERASSPEGDWESLHVLPLLNTNTWIHQDQTIAILSKENSIYYRVRLETPDGVEFTSKPVSLYSVMTKDDWLLAREINRKENVRLRKVGIPVIIFKRKLFGEKCDCIDPASGLITIDYCLGCYGTRIKGGYNPGIKVLIEIVVQGISVDMHQQGAGVQITTPAQLRMGNYPPLNKDDLLVEVQSNVRWSVWDRQYLEWKRVPVIQQAQLEKIPPSSIKYRIEYDYNDNNIDGPFYIQPNLEYTDTVWRKR